MENAERSDGAGVSLQECGAIGLGLYLCWWNAFHDEGFLFLTRFADQVGSCVACYGGAVVAGLLYLLASKLPKGSSNVGKWLLVLLQFVCTVLFAFAVFLGSAPAVIFLQLSISVLFFLTLFAFAAWMQDMPLDRIALYISIAVVSYGVFESVGWAVNFAASSFMVRTIVLLVVLGCGAFFLCHLPLRLFGLLDFRKDSVFFLRREEGLVGVPLPLLLHVGAYSLVFGLTHALASGIGELGHDKLLPCYVGSIGAGIIFFFMFANGGGASGSKSIWPKVRICVFPLAVLSFLLLPFAKRDFLFLSIGSAQCAMDVYFAFLFLALFSVARKVRLSIGSAMVHAAFIAVPFLVLGVLLGDVLKVAIPLDSAFYNVLTVMAFALLVAGTFWVGDDRRVSLVWGLEEKLTPRRFEDAALARRCKGASETFGLTKRESEILLLLAQGLNAGSISEREVISPYTARTHISRIHRKMGVHTQRELLAKLKDLP